MDPSLHERTGQKESSMEYKVKIYRYVRHEIVITSTISSGLSFGDSGTGSASGNMPPRASRASRDMGSA